MLNFIKRLFTGPSDSSPSPAFQAAPRKSSSAPDLLEAIRKGDIRMAQACIDRGADVNAPIGTHSDIGPDIYGDILFQAEYDDEFVNHFYTHWRGFTPLMLAASRQQGELVTRLITAGARVNDRDNLGLSALMHALAKGGDDVAASLLAAGADVNIASHRVEGKVAKEDEKANEYTRVGLTPLMLAAWQCRPETIRAVLDRHADPLVTTSHGWNALRYAMTRSCIDSLAEILRTLSPIPTQGLLPGMALGLLEGLLFGGLQDRPEMPELLQLALKDDYDRAYREVRGQSGTLSSFVFEKRWFRSFQFLIDSGGYEIPVNSREWIMKETCSLGEDDLLRFLLTRGIPLTPLCLPNGIHSTAIVRTLLERLSPEEAGKSLLIAAESGERESLALLLDHGCNPDYPDLEGRTPLTAALVSGHSEVALDLLNRGADVHREDKSGRAPLMVAVSYNRVDIALNLLERGADPNRADRTGRTALEIARSRKLDKVLARMVAQG